MLASDLWDLPVDLLERAISDWAVRSPYMPKASDLVNLAKGYLPKPEAKENRSGVDWEMQARIANDALAARPEGRRDIRWVATHDGIRQEFDPNYRAPMDRFMDRLHDYEIDQSEVDRAPERWRMVAMEIGYLRRMDDGQFVIRKRPCLLPGL